MRLLGATLNKQSVKYTEVSIIKSSSKTNDLLLTPPPTIKLVKVVGVVIW